jgi:hypothetical protein
MSFTHIIFTGLIAITTLAGYALINDRPSLANATAPKSGCEVISDGKWVAMGTVSISRCAGIAGKIVAQSNINSTWARWNSTTKSSQLLANRDGTFIVYRNGKAESTHYWDSEKLIEDVAEDIDAFWRREFNARGWQYQSPKELQGYAQRIRTNCGLASLNNAFYCRVNHAIYYDSRLIANQFDRVGDFASVIIIAHEWGHAIQGLRDIFSRTQFTIQTELQADCFAGAYTRDANQRGILEPGDVDEAAEMLQKIGDPANTPWYARGAHGTAAQRVSAFRIGFEKGVMGCL